MGKIEIKNRKKLIKFLKQVQLSADIKPTNQENTNLCNGSQAVKG